MASRSGSARCPNGPSKYPRAHGADVPARGRGLPGEGAGVPRRAPAGRLEGHRRARAATRPTPFTEEWRAHAARERATWRRRGPRSTAAPGSPPLEQVILAEEFTRAGVPDGRSPTTSSASRWSATRCSTGAPRSRSATSSPASSPARTSGARATSEPNAGSDLGNLGCRAVLDGDEWVINGQKIWTSAGHLANWIFVLTRTDPDVPEAQGHHVPARARWTSPASRCGPIKMISGDSRVQRGVLHRRPHARRRTSSARSTAAGRVAMTLLGYERGEAAATFPLMFRTELDRLRRAGQGAGRGRRPVDPPAAGVVLHQGRDHAVPRPAHAHAVPRRRPRPGPRRRSSSSTGASTTSRHRAGHGHPRADALVPTGAGPPSVVPDRRPGRAERHGVVGGHVPQRPGRHDLRRAVADPAQHPRRDGARPPKEPKADAAPWNEQQR